MSLENESIDHIKYSCFSSNLIFIIPHDLYDYTHNEDNKYNIISRKNSTSSIQINEDFFQNLKILSVLRYNWKNRIKKCLSSSKSKILKKLGIKNNKNIYKLK